MYNKGEKMAENNIFNKNFFIITGDSIRLELINTYEGNEKELPFYWWHIVLNEKNIKVGKISFRIGNNYHSYYNGNIGYEIDKEYRGNHDYKNSIKESILALECLFNIILDEKGLELGKALKKYFETIAIHPALKESISKLYGFASDSTGIRHDTNKESNNEGFDEAKLVLVNTSGFINFIISTKEDVESK